MRKKRMQAADFALTYVKTALKDNGYEEAEPETANSSQRQGVERFLIPEVTMWYRATWYALRDYTFSGIRTTNKWPEVDVSNFRSAWKMWPEGLQDGVIGHFLEDHLGVDMGAIEARLLQGLQDHGIVTILGDYAQIKREITDHWLEECRSVETSSVRTLECLTRYGRGEKVYPEYRRDKGSGSAILTRAGSDRGEVAGLDQALSEGSVS